MTRDPTIVLASGFAPGSQRTFDAAVELCHRLGARRLTVLRVLPRARYDASLRDFESKCDALATAFAATTAEALWRARARVRCGFGLEVAAELRFGPPLIAIERFVRAKHADVLVVGVRKRGRLLDMLSESISQALLRSMPCPVLAVGRAPAMSEEGTLMVP